MNLHKGNMQMHFTRLFDKYAQVACSVILKEDEALFLQHILVPLQHYYPQFMYTCKRVTKV